MWIGWVESNFRNPTVKFWANVDNPFKRTNYAKFCMLPSLDGTMPESVMSQENNSPLTLYIEFHNFFSSWISIVQLIMFNHKWMHNHLRPNIPKYKSREKMHYSWKVKISWNFVKFVYSSIRQLYCCDITDIIPVPPERAAYKKLTRTLKNHSSWLDYPNLPKLLLLDFYLPFTQSA